MLLGCGELAVPDSGRFILSDGTFIGSIATYSCNPGYSLVGFQTRTCQANRRWSGDAPTCEGTSFGTSFIPKCIQGDLCRTLNLLVAIKLVYEVICKTVMYQKSLSSSSSTSLSLSPFSLSASLHPSLRLLLPKVVDCGILRPPPNGRVTLPGTTFGSEAVYSCLSGFTFDTAGVEIRTCQANGRWSGEAPTCNPIERMPLIAGQLTVSLTVHVCKSDAYICGNHIQCFAV